MAVFSTLLVANLLLSPAPQLEDPKAIALFEQAKDAFEAEDWDTASKKLEQVYLIEPKPHVLYPWAQAERSAGRCDTAVDLYEKFIDSDPPTRLANAARDNIDRCKATMGSTAAPVEGTDDEVAPAMDPEDDAAADDERTDDGPTKVRRADPLGISLIAVGVAGVATGGALLGVAGKQADLTKTAETNSTYADMRKRATALRSGGIAALAIGGALVIGGAIRLGLVARKHKRQRTEVSAWIDGRNALLVWSGRF